MLRRPPLFAVLPLVWVGLTGWWSGWFPSFDADGYSRNGPMLAWFHAADVGSMVCAALLVPMLLIGWAVRRWCIYAAIVAGLHAAFSCAAIVQQLILDPLPPSDFIGTAAFGMDAELIILFAAWHLWAPNLAATTLAMKPATGELPTGPQVAPPPLPYEPPAHAASPLALRFDVACIAWSIVGMISTAAFNVDMLSLPGIVRAANVSPPWALNFVFESVARCTVATAAALGLARSLPKVPIAVPLAMTFLALANVFVWVQSRADEPDWLSSALRYCTYDAVCPVMAWCAWAKVRDNGAGARGLSSAR